MRWLFAVLVALVLALSMFGCRHAPPEPAVTAASLPPEAAEAGGVDPHAVAVAAGRALAETGAVDAAIDTLRAVLAEDPDHVPALWALAAVLIDAGRPEADLVAARAHRLAPHPDHHNARGLAALRRGAQGDAVTEFRAALALQPDHASAQLNFGWLALDSGDFAMARTRFAELAATGLREARLGMAVVLRAEGDLEGAWAVYQGLLADDPADSLARRNAALLLARYQGDPWTALGLLDAHPVADDPDIAALRTEVDGWREAAATRRADAQAAQARSKAARQARRQALDDLQQRLSAWQLAAEDSACRSQLVDAAAVALQDRDGDLALDILGMWTDCE